MSDPSAPLSPDSTMLTQDSTVLVTVALDTLGPVADWMLVLLAVAFTAMCVVLLYIWIELRRVTRAWGGLLAGASDQYQPLLEHARGAVRNLERVTRVARDQVERLAPTVEGLGNDLEQFTSEGRRRLADLSALLDVAQSEMEGTVLDTAARVRMLRAGASLLLRRHAAPKGSPDQAQYDTELQREEAHDDSQSASVDGPRESQPATGSKDSSPA